jgi:hypothetical protein
VLDSTVAAKRKGTQVRTRVASMVEVNFATWRTSRTRK